jgi:hypothetical protein
MDIRRKEYLMVDPSYTCKIGLNFTNEQTEQSTIFCSIEIIND